jgi:hypothetical protein
MFQTSLKGIPLSLEDIPLGPPLKDSTLPISTKLKDQTFNTWAFGKTTQVPNASILSAITFLLSIYYY